MANIAVLAIFSHMGGRISHTWVGDFPGSILDGRFFHISKIVGDFFTRGWANFSHMGGRFFRVNFGWAIFTYPKNSGRFSTCFRDWFSRPIFDKEDRCLRPIFD